LSIRPGLDSCGAENVRRVVGEHRGSWGGCGEENGEQPSGVREENAGCAAG
jgi:hypothetical protein